MVRFLVVCVVTAACVGSLQGEQSVHQLTNNGDQITYPNYTVLAIDGSNVSTGSGGGIGSGSDVYSAKYTDSTGDWNIAGPGTGFGDAPLFVNFGLNFIVTAERDIDLTFYQLGRANPQYPSSTTNVTMQLSGLDAWATGDDLELFSLDAGSTLYSPQVGASNPPAPNATSTNFTFDWNAQGAALPQGDMTFITQFETRSDGGLMYQTIGRFTQTMVSVSNGGSSTITASMGSVLGAPAALAVDIDADSFAAAAADMMPGGTSTGVDLYVQAKPGGLAIPFSGNTGLPDVMALHTTSNVQGTANVSNPFPSGWELYELVLGGQAYKVTAPGASMPITLHTYLEVDRATTETGTIKPTLGPVRSVKVNNADAFQQRINVGKTPLVTWSPPSLGSASGGYQVDVMQLGVSNGQTTVKTVAILETKSTSVRVPPGTLVTGSAYIFKVFAFANDRDIETKPFQTVVPFAGSAVLTATVLP